MNNIKQELQKIEIPKELNNRVASGVKQAKMEERRKKRYPKWMLGSVASAMIIGVGFTVGGSYIADAAESLINQLFGSKEELIQSLPDEPKESFNSFEQHLAFAEKHFSEEEFADYSQLIKEQIEIVSNMQIENRDQPNSEEEQRLKELTVALQNYEKKLSRLTTHTIEEAQQMVSYPIKKPTYIPEGYKQINEEIHTDENNIGKDPIVVLDYSKGEFGFRTIQQKIDRNQKDRLENWNFEHTESYSLKGFEFDYVYSGNTNVTGMRVAVPDKGYKIIMIADILSKEEMEKILLSMVEK